MDVATVKDFIDAYARWIKENTKINPMGEYTSITTPFLDRHNDRLEIYIKSSGDMMTLTDDGHIIGDLEASGVSIKTGKKLEILDMLTKCAGVKVIDGAMVVDATSDTFPG